jgi:magnesium-protoporphyrin O-methyltransferase
MECCQRVGIEDLFNSKIARDDLVRYRRKGPDRATGILLDALKAEGVEGMSLLDIGGGVGVIQHELLKSGVRSATSVEASSSYAEVAREEGERQAHSHQIKYLCGDFVELATGGSEVVPETDIVTLDRVICCYDDMQALVGLSAKRALKLYGVVYPRDHWLAKATIAFENTYHWLRRSQFRAFVHPTKAVDTLIRSAGLEPSFYQQTLYWQVVVYRR